MHSQIDNFARCKDIRDISLKLNRTGRAKIVLYGNKEKTFILVYEMSSK